jgi:ABC-type sugar transport system permease subunit
VGYGSAAAVVLFFLIFIATAVQKKFLDKEV